ncbi:MAG TPA: hypothetical protein VFD72_03175 [Sphingobacteriaceae bacterium]|nr:hypothetical protein [Sphingobacteriaceae bacterium]
MKRSKHLRLVLMLFCAGLVLQSCTKDKHDDPRNDPKPGEFEYNQNAVIVDTNPADVIVSVDEERQIYTLKSAAFQSQPKVGETILVPGEMLRKVKSVRSSGDQYIMETEDAVVTDVIKNGSLSFDTQLDWGDATSIRMGGQELLKDGLTLSSSIRANDGGIEPITSTINHGGVAHTITITPIMTGGRIVSCQFEFKMAKGETASFVASGTASLPSQQTEIVIKDGKLDRFNSDNKGLKGEFEISMAVAGGYSSSHSLPLPDLAFSFPIRVLPTPMGPIPNPIPMSVEVGLQFVSDMTITSAMSSATGKSRVTYDGQAGFTYKGTEVQATGGINSGDILEGTFDSASFGTTVDLQFGFAFPRIGLKIAGQEVAYVFFAFTTGSSIYFNPICKQGYAKMLLEGGYSLKVLGQTLLAGSDTMYENYKHAGEDCSKR